MTPSMESTATQTIATIAFGTIATIISAFTIWQGRRAWRRLYGQRGEGTAESDLESQTSEAVELEAYPNTFDHPANSPSGTPSLGVATSLSPGDERLLNPLTPSAPSTTPATATTVST